MIVKLARRASTQPRLKLCIYGLARKRALMDVKKRVKLRSIKLHETATANCIQEKAVEIKAFKNKKFGLDYMSKLIQLRNTWAKNAKMCSVPEKHTEEKPASLLLPTAHVTKEKDRLSLFTKSKKKQVMATSWPSVRVLPAVKGKIASLAPAGSQTRLKRSQAGTVASKMDPTRIKNLIDITKSQELSSKQIDQTLSQSQTGEKIKTPASTLSKRLDVDKNKSSLCKLFSNVADKKPNKPANQQKLSQKKLTNTKQGSVVFTTVDIPPIQSAVLESAGRLERCILWDLSMTLFPQANTFNILNIIQMCKFEAELRLSTIRHELNEKKTVPNRLTLYTKRYSEIFNRIILNAPITFIFILVFLFCTLIYICILYMKIKCSQL